MNGYVQINNTVYLDPNLTANDVRLLGILALKFNQFRLKGNELSIGHSELSKLSGCCLATVKNSLKTLEKQKYIIVQRNKNGKINDINKYQLTDKAVPHSNSLKNYMEYQNSPENIKKRQDWIEQHRTKPVKIPDWYDKGEDIDSWFRMRDAN